jgi:4-carboxymuconolactone decarboxylase
MNSLIRTIRNALTVACPLFAINAANAQDTVEKVPPKVTELPADIDPQSRSRLPLVKRENLDEQGKKAYDAVTDPKSRLRAELVGPAGIWLNVPELSPHIREVNWYLRNKISLDPRLTELAILVAVRESNGQNEWTAHETAGRKVGLESNYIDIVKYRRPIENVPEKEELIMRMGREILRDRKLSSPTYARLIKAFGQRAVIELVLLMANYTMTSVILQAFDQQLRPDLTPLLPVPERPAR